MKVLIEPINTDSSFILNKDEENETLSFRSISDYADSPNYVSFVLEKEEALNLAKYILKLYSE